MKKSTNLTFFKNEYRNQKVVQIPSSTQYWKFILL